MHNHVTRDIKRPGVCAGCDLYWATRPPLCAGCDRTWAYCVCAPAVLLPVRACPPMNSLGGALGRLAW